MGNRLQFPALLMLLSLVAGQLGYAADSMPIVPITSANVHAVSQNMPEPTNDIELSQRERAQQALDPITVGVGLVLISALINLGQYAWDLIVDGDPKVDFQNNSASAVPQGITNWTQLQGWKDPVSKLYEVDLMENATDSLGKIYFRLVFEAGGNYQGKGKYLANVTVIPAQITIPTRRDFFARTQVVQIVNQGTPTNPIAGMTIVLQWGLSGTIFHSPTVQTIGFHVRGDGAFNVVGAANEQPQELVVPVTVLD